MTGLTQGRSISAMRTHTRLAPNATAARLTRAEREAHNRSQEAKKLRRQLANTTKKVDKLEAAIRRHYEQVTEHQNWGADDELWAVLRLKAPREMG